MPLPAVSSRFNPSEVKMVFVRVVGGEVSSTHSLAPKIGPLGLSPREVGKQIAQATQDWKGLRIVVKLTIQNSQVKIDVVPSACMLIMKELHIPASEEHRLKALNGVTHVGNLSFEQIVDIAKELRPRSIARRLEGTVREVLGTCANVGVTVDGQNAQDLLVKIKAGELEIVEGSEHPTEYGPLVLLPSAFGGWVAWGSRTPSAPLGCPCIA